MVPSCIQYCIRLYAVIFIHHVMAGETGKEWILVQKFPKTGKDRKQV